jgi:hypothetical protein
MVSFKGAMYVGSAIQGGGFDRINNIGPAAPTLIRIWPDASWDLLVGNPIQTPQGKKVPLSSLLDGFGNRCTGYFWSMGVYDNWIYLGTSELSCLIPWLKGSPMPSKIAQRLFDETYDSFLDYRGFELWRSYDGENWLPVDRKGFGNPYNAGIRNLVGSPHGLFVCTVNMFGPRLAVQRKGQWEYVNNPLGGLEVWLGSKNHASSLSSSAQLSNGKSAT